MPFQKGHTINVGRKCSEEKKKQIGIKLKNHICYKNQERNKKIIIKYCKCGCGEEISNKWNYNLNKHIEYISGHNPILRLKGYKLTEEHKKKMSVSHKGKPSGMLGKYHKNETKLKMSLANKGKKRTEETINKIKMHHKGMKGKCHSKETKEKMRLAKINNIKRIKEDRAKQILPIKDTTIEVKIQNFLKMLGIEFFTHQYMKEIEHGYQCDILIPSMNMVIECDGDYWHKYPIGREIDHIRTEELLQKGFKVLRLWEHEIKVIDINQFKERLNEIKN